MAAELTESTSYSWYCEDCKQGGSDYFDEYSAYSEMEEHDEEFH